MAKKDVLFLLPYPLHKAPSQRFRVENLLFLMDEAGLHYDLAPFMTERTWQVLYKQGNIIQKAAGIALSFLKRWYLILFKVQRYRYVFIHREAAPLGPPLVEWLMYISGRKLIYDFDDAIWIPNTSSENRVASLFKSFWKVSYICKWSYKVAGGNDFLCSFARSSGAKDVVRVPTVVNTVSRYNRLKQHKDVDMVIGWTGSHSTLKFIDELVPILKALQKEYDFTFLVIADKKPDLDLERWTFCPWNEKTEIEDLLKIDIGVMPLKNDAWSEGKCGFKLIQYLALGIPVVANSTGVNKYIVEEGINGYLADDTETWKTRLQQLLTDSRKRAEFGRAGREKIVAEYSIESQRQNFTGLFS